jgi:uncharacterized membrane protein
MSPSNNLLLALVGAVLDPYVRDWLDLLLRWLHVVAGIVWIGTSFYFVALDSHLLPPRRREDTDEGVGGEAWEIHGGGFYRVQKLRVAPPRLPEQLIWFKWEAYGTWISGFALLVVLYYLDADTYLIDPAVADLSEAEAVAISAGSLVLGWVVYDGLCRLLARHEVWLAAAVAAFAVATAYVLSEVFGGRAVWLQTSAVLGTIMVANVFFVIIPAHRALITAKERGREPDPRPALEAKRRSVHNNYLTLPVVLGMLGGHFAFATGHERGWLILAVLMALGAWTRHFFNLRHRGRTVVAIPVTAGLAALVLAALVEPDELETAPRGGVTFAEVRTIVEQRCTPCHSQSPSQQSFAAPPKGVAFDTDEQITAQADAIEAQAVDSRAMPLGNVTGMTDGERAMLAAWLRAGAPGR